MGHPACDFAKQMMQVAFAGTGVWLSDGATNIMPVGPHRASDGAKLSAAQAEENRCVVHRAWKIHYDDVRRSLVGGFYQGWDLHPAQLPTRYAAVFAFFIEGQEAASERLRNFVAKAAQATLVGDVFDDAATGQGLLNYFLRAINCKAISEAEARPLTGLTLDGGSFSVIEGQAFAGEGLAVFFQQPILGTGLLVSEAVRVGWASYENSWITLLIDTGILGLGSFLLLCGTIAAGRIRSLADVRRLTVHEAARRDHES